MEQFFDEQELSPELQDTKKPSRRKKLIIAGSVILILLFLGWWMLGEMFGYVAHSKLETLNSRAKTVCQCAAQYAAEGHSLSTQSTQLTEETELGRYFLAYYPSEAGFYCAVVCDRQGNVCYTLYSEKPIPDSYLTAPPVREEQMALLHSHFSFRRRSAVGCYEPSDFPGLVEQMREQERYYQKDYSNRG